MDHIVHMYVFCFKDSDVFEKRATESIFLQYTTEAFHPPCSSAQLHIYGFSLVSHHQLSHSDTPHVPSLPILIGKPVFFLYFLSSHFFLLSYKRPVLSPLFSKQPVSLYFLSGQFSLLYFLSTQFSLLYI